MTRASSGLGRATAVALAQAGADVALLARGKHDLEQAAAEVGRAGRRSLVLVADLAQAEELVRTVAQVLEAFGRVDVLAKAVVPRMRAAGGGTIVNVSSVAGQARLGERRRLLRQQVRVDRADPGAGRRGPPPRHPGVCAVPRGDGDQLGGVVAP